MSCMCMKLFVSLQILIHLLYCIIIALPEGKLVGILSGGFLSRGILSEIRILALTNQIAGFVTTIV